MAGILYWLWRKYLWRHTNGVTAGSRQSKEWAVKMARIRMKNQERRQELEDLRHEAEKARLELEVAKAEAEINDYEDDGTLPEPREAPDPFGQFASVALQAIMKGKGDQNVRAIPQRSEREIQQPRPTPDEHREGAGETAQELLDEIDGEDEPDNDN